MAKLASRALNIGESATLRVARKAKELRAQGVDVIDFGAGEPDFDSPPAAVEAARQALAEGFTRYTPAAGLPELRAALAERYQRDFDAPWTAQQTIVTVGGKAALFHLALALFEEGGEVVLPSPYWVSFPEQVRFAGAQPVLVPMRPENGFALEADPVVDSITDRTRAVLLNSPCNPTGGVISPGALIDIVEACAERGIPLISDETYERFVFGEGGHASAAALAARYPETVVVVSSFSKTYAMTGWRVGYALGPAEVVDRLVAIQSHATSNVTSFAMVGALAALQHGEERVKEMVREYKVRRDLVMEHLRRMAGISCRPPAGAFYAFPRVSELYGNEFAGSVEFAEYVLAEARVALVPGVAFGEDCHLRLSFACSREKLEEGLKRMEELFVSLR